MKKTTGLLLLGAVALVGAWAVVPGQTKAAQVEEQLRRMIAERTAQTNSEMVRQVPGRFEIVDIKGGQLPILLDTVNGNTWRMVGWKSWEKLPQPGAP